MLNPFEDKKSANTVTGSGTESETESEIAANESVWDSADSDVLKVDPAAKTKLISEKGIEAKYLARKTREKC